MIWNNVQSHRTHIAMWLMSWNTLVERLSKEPSTCNVDCFVKSHLTLNQSCTLQFFKVCVLHAVTCHMWLASSRYWLGFKHTKIGVVCIRSDHVIVTLPSRRCSLPFMKLVANKLKEHNHFQSRKEQSLLCTTILKGFHIFNRCLIGKRFKTKVTCLFECDTGRLLFYTPSSLKTYKLRSQIFSFSHW